MAKELTPAIMEAVNDLVAKGGHFSLAVFDVPVDELSDATRVKVWPAKEGRGSYLSGERTIGDYSLNLYSVDLASTAATENTVEPISVIPPALVPIGHEDYPEEIG